MCVSELDLPCWSVSQLLNEIILVMNDKSSFQFEEIWTYAYLRESVKFHQLNIYTVYVAIHIRYKTIHVNVSHEKKERGSAVL